MRELEVADLEKGWADFFNGQVNKLTGDKKVELARNSERVFAPQAMAFLDMKESKFNRLVRDGKIPMLHHGKKRVFFKKHLIDFQLEIINRQVKGINKYVKE